MKEQTLANKFAVKELNKVFEARNRAISKLADEQKSAMAEQEVNFIRAQRVNALNIAIANKKEGATMDEIMNDAMIIFTFYAAEGAYEIPESSNLVKV